MKRFDRDETQFDMVSFEHIKGADAQNQVDTSLYYELLLFPVGDVELITESVHIRLNPNSMVLIPKGMYWQLVVHGNKARNHWYRLLFADGKQLQELFANVVGRLMVLKTTDRINGLFKILQEIPAEAQERAVLIQSVLVLILNEIAQNRVTEFSLQDQNEVVQQAVSYVKENIIEKLTISDIAKECRISDSALAHIFKREMNQSLYQYIIQVRLTAARQKIYEGVPAKIAAYSCGFNDYSAFYRQYKKLFGFAPTQTRNTDQEPLAENAMEVSCPAGVGETVTFLSLSTPTQGEKGLTYYYTLDGVNLIPFTIWEENAGNAGKGWWTNEDGMNLDIYRSVDDANNDSNFLLAFTANVGSIVIGYEAQKDALIQLNTWTSAYSSDYTVTVAKGELSNVQGVYYVMDQSVGARVFWLKMRAGEEIYIKYTPKEPTGDEHFGFINSLTYSDLEPISEDQFPDQAEG